jgi:hypothetical protein
MNPISHFLITWNISAITSKEKRDRILITLGGVLPDIDGLGIVLDLFLKKQGGKWLFYSEYHHYFAHNIGMAIIGSLVTFLIATRKLATVLLFLLVFHIHLL